ncbi:hypothetical protein EYF80_039427 [Liparis tanakae]|uniref:Uncharacterized protein n=1 Tax=Liparis tanakae TaxID=230148 RepID=A0A4Z2GCN2_9TELE|nr:hypothetical protein EYF80_039427 [Liparis tanakae]
MNPTEACGVRRAHRAYRLFGSASAKSRISVIYTCDPMSCSRCFSKQIHRGCGPLHLFIRAACCCMNSALLFQTSINPTDGALTGRLLRPGCFLMMIRPRSRVKRVATAALPSR